jgi:nucleoside-diphosphate-sugar epimerase
MILITGASGVVGSAVLRELERRELDRTVAFTHHKPAAPKSVRGDVTRPWLGLHPADYRDLAAQVEVVVHCAAAVNFAATPERLHRVNVVGTGNVVRFARDAGARLVHASTAFVGRAGGGTPFDAYAASKRTGETLVGESGVPHCIARISTVIGDSGSGDIPRLQAFHYLLGYALSGQLPFLPSTPNTHVDLIPRDTVAAALVALARDPDAAGHFWITSGSAALNMERILDIACDVSARRAFDDVRLRDIDQAIFRTRLIDPAVARTVISAVMARSSHTRTPSVIQRAADLMMAYIDADPFPTSLGEIPDGRAPTVESNETALRHMLDRLVELPEDTWGL